MQEIDGSVGVALPKDLERRLDQYQEIEPKAPIIDIPEVQLHAFCNVFDRWGSAPGTIALSPTRDAWLDVMAERIIAQHCLKIVVMGQRMRAGAYQRHVAS